MDSPSARASNPPVKEVVVVFKTHFDIGYTDLVTNVLTRYRTSFLERALTLIDASRELPPQEQFVWTIPGWPAQQMLWPGQAPEQRQRTLRALREGRLAVHALPCSLQTESFELEDLVRGLTFSADLARKNGLPLPRAAKMTDVPEHTWVLPTLLKRAGVHFLHIGCNGGSQPMHVPALFWWEGPDGSRLLTAYSPQYGTELVPPKDWPYPVWLAMIMTGDNHGPPTVAEVNNFLKQAATELPGVKIKFGRLEDFYDAFMAETNRDIPVVRGDMPDTWIHGFESMPIETKLAWDVRPEESAVGILDTELRAAGLKTPLVNEALSAAYENSMLYSEHTFGLDSGKAGGWRYGEDWKQARGEGKYARFEKSFDDKRAYIWNTARIVTNAYAERLKLLAANIDVKGPRIAVFNPLPWKRDGVVTVEVEGDWNEVRDLASGKEVEAVADGNRLQFLATEVPPCGYKTFTPILGSKPKAQASGAATTIESPFFALKVDAASGCIVSLRDKKTGRELVSSGEGLGQYAHERFSSNNVQQFMASYCRRHGQGWEIKDFGKPNMPGPETAAYGWITLSNWQCEVETRPFAKTIVLQCSNAAPLAKALRLKYTLYQDEPYLDVEWIIQDKTPTPLPEGGWLCLPFAIEQPSFKLARLGSVIDPAKDILEGGNRHLLCLNSGMTITGTDGYGVGLCPLDSPLVSLDEPGLWKFSLQFIPKRARVFINLYNNEWDTNFPLWQEGSWNSRVRIWACRGGETEQDLITPSWEARCPLSGAFAGAGRGKLPPEQQGVSVSRRGVLVTSLGADPYGDKTLLRVWELAGNSGELNVTLPTGLKATRAIPVNLRSQREGEPVRIHDKSFTFALHGFAPASFLLEN